MFPSSTGVPYSSVWVFLLNRQMKYSHFLFIEQDVVVLLSNSCVPILTNWGWLLRRSSAGLFNHLFASVRNDTHWFLNELGGRGSDGGETDVFSVLATRHRSRRGRCAPARLCHFVSALLHFPPLLFCLHWTQRVFSSPLKEAVHG